VAAVTQPSAEVSVGESGELGEAEGKMSWKGGLEARSRWGMRQLQRFFLVLHVLVPPHVAIILRIKSFNVGDFNLDHAPKPPKEMRNLHPLSHLYYHLLHDLDHRNVKLLKVWVV